MFIYKFFLWFPRSCVGTHTYFDYWVPGCIPTLERRNEGKLDGILNHLCEPLCPLW